MKQHSTAFYLKCLIGIMILVCGLRIDWTRTHAEAKSINQRANYASGFYDEFNYFTGNWSSWANWYYMGGFVRIYGKYDARPEIWFNKSGYTNFDYQVRMRRYGCNTCVSDIKFRDTGSRSGYFGYANNGYFTIYSKMNGINYTWLGWTRSTAISSGTNVLRVVAVGNYYAFYINNRLVASGNRTGLNSGVVGIDFYSPTPSGNFLDVDWAYVARK